MNIKLTNQLHECNNYIFFLFSEQNFNHEIYNVLKLNLKNKYNFQGCYEETLIIREFNLNILLVGMGKVSKINREKIRKTASLSYNIAYTNKFKNIILVPINNFHAISNHIEGFYLSSYKFLKYKSKKNPRTVNLTIFSKKINNRLVQKINGTLNILESVHLVRDLGNEPANKLNPISFCNIIKNLGKKSGFLVKILDTETIKKLGMNLLDSVSNGSKYGSKLAIISNNINVNTNPIVFIGKGVTFDSGGISIKPSKNMYEMKGDMLGAATVLGVVNAATLNKIQKNIIGLIPIAENMPGLNATRPGDVITSMSGKTVEIMNTDAEGRLMLADTLTYAYSLKPKLIIDLATLTGSQANLSCEIFSNILGNSNYYIKKFIQSGKNTNEKVVELPIFPEFKEMTKSSIADIKNAEYGCRSGCILAAAFLSNFTLKNVPWIHFDIAGPTTSKKKKYYIPEGTTGYGVRLCLDFLSHIN